ncbi:hypothetical protein LNY58_26585, partial [Klebsiella pneumoniae]|nr:hypothetical protein [Klebsiella pneumoniae]
MNTILDESHDMHVMSGMIYMPWFWCSCGSLTRYRKISTAKQRCMATIGDTLKEHENRDMLVMSGLI